MKSIVNTRGCEKKKQKPLWKTVQALPKLDPEENPQSEKRNHSV